MPYKVDFKQLAEDIDISIVAAHLKLQIVKDRAHCPACDTERAIQFFPETNTFRCHTASLSGDCISLFAHIKGYQGMYKAAKDLSELFAQPSGARTTIQTTAPQKPPVPTPVASTAAAPGSKKSQELPFDLVAFAAKLIFSDEVAALATEEDAAAFRIGFYRGHLYLPAVYATGAVAGWWKLADGKLVPPKQWLPDTSNVVQLKRPA